MLDVNLQFRPTTLNPIIAAQLARGLVSRCTKCGETQDVSQFYWMKAVSKWTSHCRTCDATRHRLNHLPFVGFRPLTLNARIEKQLRAGIVRTCSKCHELKDVSEFGERRGAGAWDSQCRDCKNAHHKLALSRDGVKERYKPTQQAYYARNRTTMLRTARESHRRLLIAARENEESYRSYRLARSASSNRYRARKLGGTPDAVDYAAILERDGLWCYLCEQPVESQRQLSFDHVIPLLRDGQHCESNIKVAHRSCNSGKRDRTAAEYRRSIWGL